MNKRSSSQGNDPLYGMVDERTKEVANQGDAYTARFMLFAVLADVALRGFGLFENITESNWDLMGIVMVGSLISTVYQMRQKTIFNRPRASSFLYIVMIMGLGALVAFLISYFRR